MRNHHLIAYSLSNISAKNYQNRLMCVEVIGLVCNISVVFENQCTIVTLCVRPSVCHSGDSHINGLIYRNAFTTRGRVMFLVVLRPNFAVHRSCVYPEGLS